MTESQLTVWTVGHSTRSAEEFVRLMATCGIELVADVRRFPGSRRLPHFAAEALAGELEAAGIAYYGFPLLGGRRRPDADSVNTGWRHPAFRGYADHLASDEFAAGLAELLAIAGGVRTTVMCAEMLWWQCHRRLIADVLVSLGYEVLHIQTEKPADPHRLIDPAHLVDGTLSYVGDQPSLFGDTES